MPATNTRSEDEDDDEDEHNTNGAVMIVRSIRLKNIKSYGEGPDGNGVTVHFEQGINRIAGKNGHGKTTLIESLGYALFLTKPVYEEGFEVATYLLRSGEKAAEIDVVFEHGGQAYRLERGLGSQKKRRSKVVLLGEESIEAEGDEEVSTYLCRLLGFSAPERLEEMFSKLVGVKQGRLTWAFDSKPTEARRHFEPLLDVEIFRECSERLRPVVTHFEKNQQEQDKELAAVAEAIRDREGSGEKVKLLEREVQEKATAVERGRVAKKDADQQRQAHEQKERVYRETKAAADATESQFKLAAQKRVEAEQRVRESQQAAETLTATQSAHDGHVAAEAALRKLQESQVEKSKLQQQHAAATNQKTEMQGKANAARQQGASLAEQQRARLDRKKEIEREIEASRKALQQEKPEFERQMAASENARRCWEALRHWGEALEGEAKKHAELARGILADWKGVAGWDAKALVKAREETEQTEKTEKVLAERLAGKRKLRETLSEQLKEISGGVCPFLQEKCKQFDPKKIQADLSTQEQEIKQLAEGHDKASKAVQRARELAEKLSQESIRLAEAQKSVSRDLGLLAKERTELLPTAIRRQLEALKDYLPEREELAGELPIELAARDYHDPKAGTLDTQALQESMQVEREFCRKTAETVEAMRPKVEAKFREFEKQKEERAGAERDVRHKQEMLAELETELKGLGAKIEQAKHEAEAAEAATTTANNRLVELEEKLRPLAKLQEEMAEQTRLKDSQAEGHQKFLGAKPSAERLPERRNALQEAIQGESHAEAQRREKSAAHEVAQREFDPAALALARQQAEAAGNALAADTIRWENARKELEKEQKRFSEWETACLRREAIAQKQARTQACIDLTQKARQILQKTAPLVAEQVCQRIAARAQQIFSQINLEPIKLEWSAERYSLRIDPGERRFAMLSGGEQTKLALAMTLAMIKEFSGLNFCVFDEPTYGVDADSREKLADAIVRLQQGNEKRLDQLLLVSHDDAFEGKTENVVLIKKTAAQGSMPVEQGMGV